MSLFIAPPGAMQFEITHPDSPYKGEVFWVAPYTGEYCNTGWSCDCGKQGEVVQGVLVFQSYRESMSARMKAICGTADIIVCCHVGRIIE